MNLDNTDSKLMPISQNFYEHNTNNVNITTRLECLSKYNRYYLKFKQHNQSDFLSLYASLRKKIIFLDIIIASIDTITIMIFCYIVLVSNLVHYACRC